LRALNNLCDDRLDATAGFATRAGANILEEGDLVPIPDGPRAAALSAHRSFCLVRFAAGFVRDRGNGVSEVTNLG
jgi:hypothetical protein